MFFFFFFEKAENIPATYLKVVVVLNLIIMSFPYVKRAWS